MRRIAGWSAWIVAGTLAFANVASSVEPMPQWRPASKSALVDRKPYTVTSGRVAIMRAQSPDTPDRSASLAGRMPTLGRPMKLSESPPSTPAADPGVRPATFSPMAPVIPLEPTPEVTIPIVTMRPIAAVPTPSTTAMPAPTVTVPELTSTPMGDCTGPAGCMAPTWCAAEECIPASRAYARAEYLYWHIKEANSPVLITSGTQASLGILGLPGTNILFGGSGLDQDWQHGGRFTAGFWLDECETIAIEASAFFLQNRSLNFAARSRGTPVLALPYTEIGVNGDLFPIALPVAAVDRNGVPRAGGIVASLSSDLWGFEANARKNMCFGTAQCVDNYSADVLLGYRYVQLVEKLNVAGACSDPACGFFLTDQFNTRNVFSGGQVGVDAEYRRDRWFLNLRGKLGIGNTSQTVSITGATVGGPGTDPTLVRSGGLRAVSSNIGHYEQNSFSLMPEIGVNVGYQLTGSLRVFAGYNLLYWTSVVRPGDQIDPVINSTLVPVLGLNPAGPARPTFNGFKESDFWVHGFNVGLEMRY